MAVYIYEGRDVNGKFITDERIADSAEILSGQLFNEGITPIHIVLKKEKSNFWQKFQILVEPKHIDNNELALFARQMHTLSKSGVLISSAMKYFAKTAHNQQFAQVLLEISQKLESGQDLSTAMADYPKIFSPLVVAIIRIGQNTGQLDKAFLRLTEYLELENSTVKRVKTVLRYPIFVITSIIAGIVILNLFVIPAFAKVYMRANIPLPWMTAKLIMISNFFTNYWQYLLILFIVCAVATYQYLKRPRVKYLMHKYQLKIPGIGYLLRRIILLRFSEAFAIIVDSGVPINEGLTLVAESITNQYARAEFLLMRDAIQRGSNILQAATNCKLFTGLELQMFSVSEETGELGKSLNEMAQYYQREVDYDLKHLIDVVEPILLLGIALIVLFLALAVYMPIWNMVKLIHRG